MNRTRRVTFRLTEKEYQAFERACKQCEVGKSEFLRTAINVLTMAIARATSMFNQ